MDDAASYCPDCGHSINDSTSGVDYDLAMSIDDASSRRKITRWICDIIALFGTAGFWVGWLLMEVLIHHRKLNKGEREPWEKGDEKMFWFH
jgi:hypothetical protein